MNLRGHLRYLSYVLRHKWHVFLFCWKLGIPWRGVMHDMSKFRPSEWGPYVAHFYGEPGSSVVTKRDATGYYKAGASGDEAFDFAWHLHQKRNDHHWQWWILTQDDDGEKVFEMPEAVRCEMVADWLGAGAAQGKPDVLPWWDAHKDSFRFGPETRAWVEGFVAQTRENRRG